MPLLGFPLESCVTDSDSATQPDPMAFGDTDHGDGRWSWSRRGLVIVGIWSIPAASTFVAVLMQGSESQSPEPFWYVALKSVYMWAVFAALTPAVIMLQRRAPAGRWPARHWIPAHGGFSVLFAVAAIAIIVPAEFVITGLGEPAEDPGTLGDRFASAGAMLIWTDVFYWLILAVVCAADGARRARQQERRASALEQSLATARMDALRSQLHPHFLFNTLNSISSLIRQNRNSDAVEMIGGLSELLRESLRQDTVRVIPLSEELELAERYLAIEQPRFGDRLTISHDIEPEAERVLVPPLRLQPLLENAIHHGVAPRAEGGRIDITARVENGRLYLLVENDGDAPTLPPPDATRNDHGVGLRNTRERIEAIYGSDGDHLVLRARAGGGTVVEINLPADGPDASEASS